MTDAYQMVTDRILALMQQGIIPWQRPWRGVGCAVSHETGNPYSFLNQLMLADPDKKYNTMEELKADISGEWITFNQAHKEKGHVKRGAKGRRIIFYKMIPKKADEDAEKVEYRPVIQSYVVFKVSDCEGVKPREEQEDLLQPIQEIWDAESVADEYLKRSGVSYHAVKGNRAFYSPTKDMVVTPLKEQFSSSPEYYSTLFHELAHSTGHSTRLNRFDSTSAYHANEYGVEELIAEITSASCLATLGVETPDSMRNSAAYIQNWMKAIKDNKRMFAIAAAKAEKALQLVLFGEQEAQA